MKLDALVNDFAIRSFRDMGDGDYIAARLAYRSQLVPQFLWQSLQALEKYLKCILVLNRIEAGRGHNLAALLQQTQARCGFDLRLSDTTRDLISYLDGLGSYRYFEVSYFIHGPKLVVLDRAAWELRRYAKTLKYEIDLPDGRKQSMLPKELDAIKNAESLPPTKFRLAGGYLERIIDNPIHTSRPALIWQNAYFGRRGRKRVRMQVHFAGANSPLTLHPEILDEVLKYVWMPRHIIDSYRKAS